MMGYHAPDENNHDETTQDDSNLIDDLYVEVLLLREKVRQLEENQKLPDNGFWCQLIFDVMAFAAFVYLLMLFYGR